MSQPEGQVDAGYEAAREAANFIHARIKEPPRIAIILGTGLGRLADRIAEPAYIPYQDIPHFPRSTVVGHAGRLVFGTLGNLHVAAMQGRFHLYEGYTPQQVVLPVRVLHLLGAEALIATNAAGGLAPDQHAGDLLLLRDHIGMPTLSGLNPLVGPNDERLGPRFPPMTDAYDPTLRSLATATAQQLGLPLREGIYAMVSGPNYESPAELRFLRTVGADAVGMSTVPEIIAARHMGMRVLAISCITNVALPSEGASEDDTSHEAVVATAEAAGAKLTELVEGIIQRL